MRKLMIPMILSVVLLCGCGARQENTTDIDTAETTVQWESLKDVQIENQGMDETLAETLQKSMVLIDTGELSGSGFIWEFQEDMVIVTAGHVLEQVPGAIYVTLSDGYRMTADLYWKCENSDLAFLKIKGERIPKLHKEYYVPVPHSAEHFNQIQPEDALYAMGYTGMAALRISSGTLTDKWIYVESFEQFMVLAQTEIQQGMSGGGVLDTEGYLIGILCGTDREGQAVAVPSQVVDAELISLYW